MDIEALRNAVVADPTDVKAFTELHDACIESKDFATLKEVFETVFPAIEDSPEKDRILRVVDKQARTHPDAGVKHWLNAQLGLLFWKTLDNPDRAEVYFRRVQDAAGQKGGLVGEFSCAVAAAVVDDHPQCRLQCLPCQTVNRLFDEFSFVFCRRNN